MKFTSLHLTDTPYHYAFAEHDLLGFEVLLEDHESIGKVIDVLMDDTQRYHLAVEHQSLLSQERFIVPVTACKIATSEHRIYITEMGKSQLRHLPVYHKKDIPRYVDGHASKSSVIPEVEALPVEASLPLEYGRSLESGVSVVHEGSYQTDHQTVTQSSMPVNTSEHVPMNTSATTYIAADNTPILSVSNPPTQPIEHVPTPVVNQPITPEKRSIEEHTVPLLAERLVVDQQRRRKVGEVIVRKVIETQMVNVPVRREKLIVEQISPEHRPLAAIDLGQGELSQVELRQLMPDLSDDEIHAVHNRTSEHIPSSTEAVSLPTALQILQQITQVPQFTQTTVRLVFDNEELQQRYQRWLVEHKN